MKVEHIYNQILYIDPLIFNLMVQSFSPQYNSETDGATAALGNLRQWWTQAVWGAPAVCDGAPAYRKSWCIYG